MFHHRSKIILLLMFYCLPLIILASVKASASSSSEPPILCLVTSPFETPYVKPWFLTPSPALGCVSSEVTAGGQEVHVIKLNQSTDNEDVQVVLRPKPIKSKTNHTSSTLISRKYVIVLDAPTPVRWKVVSSDNNRINNNGINIYVIGDESTVESEYRWTLTRRKLRHQVALVKYVRKRFGALTSYSLVPQANRITLILGEIVGYPPSCDPGLEGHLRSTSVVDASLAKEQRTIEGCFHGQNMGGGKMGDVHVIELVSAGMGWNNTKPYSTNDNNRNSSFNAKLDVGGGDQLAQVHLYLAPEDVQQVARNLTLVLKAHEPVKWQLSSERVQGTLVVVADNAVVNAGMSPNQILEVRRRSLPDGFDVLLLQVTTEFGPPVMYVKTPLANEIDLLISYQKQQKEVLPSILHQLNPTAHGPLSSGPGPLSGSGPFARPWESTSDSDLFWDSRPLDFGGIIRNPASILGNSMHVQCSETTMEISFPLNLVDKIGIIQMKLNDPSCLAQKNSTHWYLVSHITSCGSTGNTDLRSATFSNNVYMEVSPFTTDDEDLVGGSGWGSSGSSTNTWLDEKIPFKCHQKPKSILGHFPMEGEDNVMDPVEKTDIPQSQIYDMHMYADADYTQKIPFPSEVEKNEVIYVDTILNGVPFVHIVMETCWITNASVHHYPSLSNILVKNTCAAESSVHIQRNSVGSRTSFSFKVNGQYEQLGHYLYLHCLFGVCTTDVSRAKGNLMLCVDHKEHCLKDASGQQLASSTAQQIRSIGPLIQVRKRQRNNPKPTGQTDAKNITVLVLGTINNNNPAYPSTKPPAALLPTIQSTQIVLVGVTVEVAVAIAMGSFACGAILTAILWYIHLKTGTGNTNELGCEGGESEEPPTVPPTTENQPVATARHSSVYDLSPHSSCPTPNSQTPMTG